MNKKDIKFSIIIPVYNASGFIKDTLDSIKNQTYKNYEVLITNDGSTDNTEKVLKEYKRLNPGFPLSFVTQKNKGVSSARNNAIFRSSGDYIAFLDQDDWWFPNKLEMAAEVLSSNRDIDILYHEAVVVNWKKGSDFYRLGALKEPVYLDLLFGSNKIGISTAVVKKGRLVKEGGFSAGYIYSEDYDLWLRLARKGASFFYLKDFLGKYILRPDSESNKVENMTREKLEILEKNYRLLIENGKYNKKYLNRGYRRAKSVMLFGASRRFYFLGDYKRAVDYSISSIKNNSTFLKPYIGLMLSRLGDLKCSGSRGKNKK
jgi:glycosyltransferase involved in cell wall biosynthesis